MWWHRLLCFLGVRDELDYAEPGLGPEVPHPYIGHAYLYCCDHCGGGRLNAIHRPPYDPRRTLEILQGYARYPGEPLPNLTTGAGVEAYVKRGRAPLVGGTAAALSAGPGEHIASLVNGPDPKPAPTCSSDFPGPPYIASTIRAAKEAGVHLGTHPLTEHTCDYEGCWCRDLLKGWRPASVEREH